MRLLLCKSCRAHGRAEIGGKGHVRFCPFAQCPCSKCVAVRRYRARWRASRKRVRERAMETVRATLATGPPAWAPSGLILGPRRGPGRPRKTPTPLSQQCQAANRIRRKAMGIVRPAAAGPATWAPSAPSAPSGPQRSRKPGTTGTRRYCRSCRAHWRVAPLRGARHDCPFALCQCSECVIIKKARASNARDYEIRKRAMESVRMPATPATRATPKPRGLIMVPVVTLEDGDGPAAPAAPPICTEYLVTKRTKLKKAGRAGQAHRRASAMATTSSAQCAPEAGLPAGAPQSAQPEMVLGDGPAGPSASIQAGRSLHHAGAVDVDAEGEAGEATRLHDGAGRAGPSCPECPKVEMASAEALQDHCDSHMSLLSLGRLKALFKMIIDVRIADSAA